VVSKHGLDGIGMLHKSVPAHTTQALCSATADTLASRLRVEGHVGENGWMDLWREAGGCLTLPGMENNTHVPMASHWKTVLKLSSFVMGPRLCLR